MVSDTCRERAVQARGANVRCHVARTFARESEAIAICVVCLRSTSSSRAGRSFVSPQLCGHPFRASSQESEDSLRGAGRRRACPRKRFDAIAPSASEKSTARRRNCRETENVSFESVGRADAFRRSPPSVQVLRSLCPLKTGPLQLGQGRRYTRRCPPPGFSRPCGAR